MKLSKPTNEYALVVKVLIENKQRGISQGEISQQYYFGKFQTRLGELERSHDRKEKLKVRRLPVVKEKGRFEKPVRFLNYKSLAPKAYLYNLYAKLNREGLK